MPAEYPRRYGILGTGALGGFYGARLQRAGLEVHFLLRSDYQWVRDHGLAVESIDGNFTLPQVNAYPDIQEMPPCDVVVVALKTTQNHLLPRLIPAILKPEGMVLVLQNGLGVETQVAEIVGPQRVVGGLCFLCSNKIGPGHIRHLDYGQITLADYGPDYWPQGITKGLHSIAADFEQAGIPIQLSADLGLARWQKLVWNIPFNGLSVVLDADTDALITDASTRQLLKALMQEVVTAAHHCGVRIAEGFIESMLQATTTMKPYRTSMKIDFDAGRPLEVEAILGAPLRQGSANGADLPLITMLYQQLKFLEKFKGSAKFVDGSRSPDRY